MLDTDLGAEDREAMRKARNAPLFSAKLKEAEWALDALQGAELERECAALLEAKF
ncbi:MAG: hypothetical protein LBE33_02615 [Zoogloeaceae bacterium]|nr:hypothetical protein [Zoogloeaceae bacterium]